LSKTVAPVIEVDISSPSIILNIIPQYRLKVKF